MHGNSMKKILVSGCSMANGHGLENEKHNVNLWVNRLFDTRCINNIALSGRNNHNIFINTISELVTDDYDLAIVAWSTIPRINVNIGLETYETITRLTDCHDVNTNLKNYKKKYLQKVGDILREFHNDHWDIISLIAYVNALLKIQDKPENNKQIFFVNTLGPWPENFFEYKKIDKPSDLLPYTQDMLNVDTRDDEEIFQLYDMIHQQYKKFGGINNFYWLNLYDSFRKMQVDNASQTDFHPGIKSQCVYSEYLLPILAKKLNNHNVKYLNGVL